MRTKPAKPKITRSDKKKRIDGFTLDADGVVRPATGLELHASRLFFCYHLRYRKIDFDQVPRCSFEVQLHFQVATGLFEAQVRATRVGLDETILVEGFPKCRSLEEAKHAFDCFF
jgi:hypothetical protein